MKTQSPPKPTKSPLLLALATIIPTSLLLSILVLSFKSSASLSYLNTINYGDSMPYGRPEPDAPHGGPYLALYPLHLNDRGGSVSLVLAGASISMCLSLALGTLSWFAYRRSKAVLLSNWQRLAALTILAGNAILSLAITIIALIHRFQSGRFDPAYRSPGQDFTYYDQGSFDLGSWTCQLRTSNAVEGYEHAFAKQCTGENVALWVGILLVLCDVGMAGLVWMDWRGGRVLIRGYGDAFGEEYECEYLGE